MPEKYKAQRNNENVSNEQQEKERSDSNNAANVKAAGDVLMAVPHPYAKAAGAIIKGADKITGGKSSELLGKAATQVFKNNPSGGGLQNASNLLNETGANKLISKTASMKSGSPSSSTGNDSSNASNQPNSAPNQPNSAPNQPNNAPNLSGINNFVNNNVKNNSLMEKGKEELNQYEEDRLATEQSKGSEWNQIKKTNDLFANNMFKRKMLKIKIIAIAVFFGFILLITVVVAAKDFGNLELTNETTSITGTGPSGTSITSPEQLEGRLIYLGDSRTVGMESTLNNSNITYIAEVGKGYSWLINNAAPQLDSLLQEKQDGVVVLALGVNDLYNIDNYISFYNELINKYPTVVFYILSVNPVDEQKASANGYTITNADIESFNSKLKSNFSDNYIDTYSGLSIGSTDGLHYDNQTYTNIHNSVVSSIISSGKVKTFYGGDLAAKLEEVGMWYIENVRTYQNGNSGSRKYYKTPFGTRSFGDDCTEFIAAYMSYVCGSDIQESYSGDMVYPTGSWATSVASCGWKAYSSDEVGTLQTGDVLIANKGALYSKFGQHGEVYINESQTFGWGSVKTAYPSSNTIKTVNEGGHVHFQDATHDYITVYRYGG